LRNGHPILQICPNCHETKASLPNFSAPPRQKSLRFPRDPPKVEIVFEKRVIAGAHAKKSSPPMKNHRWKIWYHRVSVRNVSVQALTHRARWRNGVFDISLGGQDWHVAEFGGHEKFVKRKVCRSNWVGDLKSRIVLGPKHSQRAVIRCVRHPVE